MFYFSTLPTRSNTGYPIPERTGVLRYFYRIDGEIIWADTREELVEKYKANPRLCKSVTFISSSVYDNLALLNKNPEYLASLNALSIVERERLLKGNWKIRPAAGLYFGRDQITIVDSVPDKIVSLVRSYDLAATVITIDNKDPDRTASVLMAKMRGGMFIILDVVRDDQVDATSDAFATLANISVYSAPPDMETKNSYWNL